MNWDDLKYFLAIARHRSLSAAARELRVTQSTAGRRLEALETGLAVKLLKLTPDGYVPTPAGIRVIESTERIESEALAIEREVNGADAQLEGTVRVTTIETLGAVVLAPLFVELRRSLPDVLVELVTENQSLNLFKRDADIAVRLTRPKQKDLVVKKVGEISFALYASDNYLAEHSAPDFSNGCVGHGIVAMNEENMSFPDARWFSELTNSATTIFSSNSRLAHIEAALSGAGIVCLPRYLADRHAKLVRIEAPDQAPSREIWLAVHKDTRNTPRIRAVLNALAEGFETCTRTLNPR